MNFTDQVKLAAKVELAITTGRAIPFFEEEPDRDYPAIRWSCYGLVDTNEIAVVARCHVMRYFATAESNLLYPVMADRIFGMDVADDALSRKLADAVWEQYSGPLTTMAEAMPKPASGKSGTQDEND